MVLTWKMDIEMLGRGLEFARRWKVTDEKIDIRRYKIPKS